MIENNITPPAMKREPADTFLDMLQGAALHLTIGPSTPSSPATIYILPRTLLSVHSTFFHSKCTATATATTSSTTPSSTISLSTVSPGQIQANDQTHISLNLPDIDPTIFGLFLKFIYQGSYPATRNVATTTPLTPSVDSSVKDTVEGNKEIPPPIQAWILGQILDAKLFQNHSIVHIYGSLGRTIFLTPSLVQYVWDHTSSPSSHPTLTPVITATPSTAGTRISESPLRKLILDVLTFHWSAATPVVNKSPGLHEAWNSLFSKYDDLRCDFILGLQASRKVGSVQVYFTGTATGMGAGADAISANGVSKIVAQAKAKTDTDVKDARVGKVG